MPKIVQYNLPPGGTVVQLADNTSEALDIETINADGSTGDYITIDTTDSNEVLNLSAGGAAAKTLSVRSDGRAIWGNSNSFWQSYEDASATNPNSGPRKSDWDTGIGSPAVDQLSLVAGGQEGIRITEAGDAISAVNVNGSTTIQTADSGTAVDVVVIKSSGGDTVAKLNTTNTNGGEIVLYRGGSPAIGLDVNGGAYFNNPGLGVDFRVETDNKENAFLIDGSEDSVSVGGGGCGTALTGTFTATNNDLAISSGSSTAFLTELHVGSAIQIGSEGTYTVAAIASNEALTLDSVFTGSTGASKSGTTDSGELFAVKTGDSKTIFGVNAEGGLTLTSAGADTSYSNNLAIGDSDILSKITTGNRIVAIGHSSTDWDFTTCDSTVVIGYDAGEKISTSARCIIVGQGAGTNITGSNNVVVIGQNGGQSSGSDCTYIGRAAGQNSTSANNVAIGSSALSASGNPSNGVAVGKDAGKSATNTALTCVGYRAGQSLTTGQGCTFVGADADAASTATADNQTVIGKGAAAHGANTVTLGNASVTSIDSHSDQTVDLGQVAYEFDAVHCVSVTEVSDARLKEDITDTVMGLDFINSLRPVSYKFKDIERKTETVTYETEETVTGEDGNETVQVVTEEKEVLIHPGKTHNRKHQGLLAQEVKASLDAAGIDTADFGGFVDANVVDGVDKLALRYNQFIGPLIKAVQELSARIEQLEGGD